MTSNSPHCPTGEDSFEETRRMFVETQQRIAETRARLEADRAIARRPTPPAEEPQEEDELEPCALRKPRGSDIGCWALLVPRVLLDDEARRQFAARLPRLAALAGIEEAALELHGTWALILVPGAEDAARRLHAFLARYRAVFVGATQPPPCKLWGISVLDVPRGMPLEMLQKALHEQFPDEPNIWVRLEEGAARATVTTTCHAVFLALSQQGGLRLFSELLYLPCAPLALRATRPPDSSSSSATGDDLLRTICKVVEQLVLAHP